MIAALIIFGLIATIALLIPVSFEIIAVCHKAYWLKEIK